MQIETERFSSATRKKWQAVSLDAGRNGAVFFQDKVEMADFSLDAGRNGTFFF